jgi:hypothetical protein
MVYGHFHEKSFTKVSYLKLVCLDFKGNELGFCLLKKKTFESCPIFGRVPYNPVPNNFCHYGIVGCQEKMGCYQCAWGSEHTLGFCEVATKGRVQNGTTTILLWCGSLKGVAIPVVSSIFSVCSHILHLFGHSDVSVQFWNRGYLECTLNFLEENTLHVA